MITWEIRKIFKSKNGIIALILFIILSISMVFIKPALVTNVNRNNEPLITVEEEFNNKIQQLEEVSQNEDKDEVSKDLREIANEKLAAMKSNEYKDVRFWQVLNHRAGHPFMIFIMLAIIIIFFSNIYTDEIISDMDSLILSLKNKNKVLYSKLAISIGLPTIFYAIYLILQFIVTYIQYGKPINGNLLAIRILDIPLLVKAPYTIYGFIMLKIGMLLVVLLSLSILASLISFITKNSIQSTSGFLIFIFLGRVITLIKWLPKTVLLIISKINYIDLLSNFNGFVGMYSGRIGVSSISLDVTNLSMAILIGTMLIEILLCTITFKKFLTR